MLITSEIILYMPLWNTVVCYKSVLFLKERVCTCSYICHACKVEKSIIVFSNLPITNMQYRSRKTKMSDFLSRYSVDHSLICLTCCVGGPPCDIFTCKRGNILSIVHYIISVVSFVWNCLPRTAHNEKKLFKCTKFSPLFIQPKQVKSMLPV